jgi:succinate dehydrogenase / fumarate reductase cytochrome b subunit
MKWLFNFLTSSIGQKVLMSLTGLFLCTFLVVHMAGNLQLFVDEDGKAFNAYAKFMTSSPLIKTVSYGLYLMILLHAFKGIGLWMYNRKARGGSYRGKDVPKTELSFAARNMAYLGMIIFAFLGLHMAQFWGKMHFGTVPLDQYGNKDLFLLVSQAFKDPIVVVVYLLSLVALSLHLLHGFQSAFQTLGLHHKKYTPLIKGLGYVFSIVIPLGFASMPVYFLVKSV